MKFLLAVGITLAVTGCNNNENSTVSNQDTSFMKDDTSVHAPQVEQTGKLAEAMNSMMQEMKTMAMTGDPDNDFAMMMKRHHLGAIEMANIEIASGKDADLKAMAKKIIDDQQKEINEFNNFLSSHNSGSKTDFAQNAMKMMDKSSEMSMNMHGANVDPDFATMMIQHHQGAIDMAKEYLKMGHEPAIKTIAQNIISSQQKEIKQLNDLKNKYSSGAH